jgi:hypothetical protein
MKSPKEIKKDLERLHNPTEEEKVLDVLMTSNRKARKEIKFQRKKVAILEKTLERCEDQFDVLSGIVMPETYPKSRRRIIHPDYRRKNEATAFALLGDVHADEYVDPATVNNWNYYTPDISERRLNTFCTGLLKTTRELRKTIPIPHLVLGFMGDFISGYIHDELQENNLLSPTEGIQFIEPILVDIVKRLSEDGDFKSIEIPMLRGNHGRTTEKIRHSTDWKNSFEQLMYFSIVKLFTEQLVGYNNVKFTTTKSSFVEVEVYGKKITFNHGNEFRYLGGIGGLEIPMRRWGYKMQKAAPADKRYLAHHHKWMPGGIEVVNGCMIGYNKFAMDKAFEPELPQMHYELLDRNRGAFTIKLPIIVDSFYKR